MSESSVNAAVSRLRDKTTQPPHNILADHQPHLLSFSEFIARSKTRDRLLPESIRIANRQLSEQLGNDDTLDYCYSEIPLSVDDAKKAEAVEEIYATIARFTETGDVLLFAICVMPE